MQQFELGLRLLRLLLLLEAGHVDRPAGVALALIALKPRPRPREPRPRLLLEHPSTVDE